MPIRGRAFTGLRSLLRPDSNRASVIPSARAISTRFVKLTLLSHPLDGALRVAQSPQQLSKVVLLICADLSGDELVSFVRIGLFHRRADLDIESVIIRSEERRVGKEC